MSGVFVSLAAFGRDSARVQPPPAGPRTHSYTTGKTQHATTEQQTPAPAHTEPTLPAAAARGSSRRGPHRAHTTVLSRRPAPSQPPQQPVILAASASTQEDHCSDSDTWSQLAEGDTDEPPTDTDSMPEGLAEMARQRSSRAPANASHDGSRRRRPTEASGHPDTTAPHNPTTVQEPPAQQQQPGATQPPTRTPAKTTPDAKEGRSSHGRPNAHSRTPPTLTQARPKEEPRTPTSSRSRRQAKPPTRGMTRKHGPSPNM